MQYSVRSLPPTQVQMGLPKPIENRKTFTGTARWKVALVRCVRACHPEPHRTGGRKRSRQPEVVELRVPGNFDCGRLPSRALTVTLTPLGTPDGDIVGKGMIECQLLTVESVLNHE